MLQKDNEDLVKGLKETYKKELDEVLKGKTSVVFKLVRSIHNGKDKKPRSYSIENDYISNEKNGDTSHYRLYKSKTNKNVGGFIQPTFSPAFTSFSERGDIIINVGENKNENLDKVVWLLKHPRRALSMGGDGVKRALFYLEDKNKEAIEKVALKKAKAKMDMYLYDDEKGLHEDRLRTIAEALRVSDVKNMNKERIQTSIEDACKKNPSLFLGMIDVNSDTVMRANIQKAVEKQFLTYDRRRLRWVINDADSGNREDLAPVKKLDNETDSLIYWFNNIDENNNYAKVEELLTGKIIQKKIRLSETDKLQKLQDAKNKELELQIKLAELKRGVVSAENPVESVDTETGIDKLREEAKKMGLSHHPNMGDIKLSKLIQDAKELNEV